MRTLISTVRLLNEHKFDMIFNERVRVQALLRNPPRAGEHILNAS